MLNLCLRAGALQLHSWACLTPKITHEVNPHDSEAKDVIHDLHSIRSHGAQQAGHTQRIYKVFCSHCKCKQQKK